MNKKIFLVLFCYYFLSLIIGLIFGGAIAGSHTLFPILPSQFMDKVYSLIFAFALGSIPALVIFIVIFVIKYIYTFLNKNYFNN